MTRAGEELQTPDAVEKELLGWLGEGPRGLPVRECQASDFDPNSLEVPNFREPLVRYVSPTVQVSIRSSHDIKNKVECIID